MCGKVNESLACSSADTLVIFLLLTRRIRWVWDINPPKRLHPNQFICQDAVEVDRGWWEETFEIMEIISGSSSMYFQRALKAEICRPYINGSVISALAMSFPHDVISW